MWKTLRWICSKLKGKTPKRRHWCPLKGHTHLRKNCSFQWNFYWNQWRLSGVFPVNFKHIQRKIFHTDVMLLILTFEYLLRICLLWKLKWWFRTTYLINNFETYEHFKWKQKIYLRPSWARLSLQTRYFPRVLHVHSF